MMFRTEAGFRTRGKAPSRAAMQAVIALVAALLTAPLTASPAQAEPSASCATDAACAPITATNPTICDTLDPQITQPANFIAGGQIQLDRFAKIVGDWMGGYCYRRRANNAYLWPHDATARDTGPFISQFVDGKLTTKSHSSHVVARVWYSPSMHTWMLRNRPANEHEAPADPTDIPDGAIMVKEMWPAPAAQYSGDCFDCMAPGSSGAVIFIRDSKSFSSGWFVGWWGAGAVYDWPPSAGNGLTSMGDGGQQFCTNCHASTTRGNTFASINNIAGSPATFLTQWVPPPASADSENSDDDSDQANQGQDAARHADNAIPLTQLQPIDDALPSYARSFLQHYPHDAPAPANMPSQTFDSVLVPGHGELPHFMPSSQCVGCHQANATGLQLDMLDYSAGPLAEGGEGKPVSISPYSLWSSSPMGLAGRDPIFYAQLESEQIFHADMDQSATPAEKQAMRSLIQDTCLMCHGNMGQRQHAIDSHEASGECAPFARETANAVPFPYTDESWPAQAQQASYGALARDGISCATCHHIALDKQADEVKDAAWNTCIQQKQQSLNPTFSGFAATFSGTHPVGPADEINGPFAEPKTAPMLNSLRLNPKYDIAISSSEVCGSCHTIHLPVLDRKQPEDRCIGPASSGDPLRCFPKRYEQTTYAEWAFSAYRSGTLGSEKLPSGPGATPQTCQHCHMPDRDAEGRRIDSKVALIEEYSNYPQTDYRLDAEEIDLPVRDGFAQHLLVGLNVFLIEMAQQHPDVLGIRTVDPAMGGMNIAPLQVTENAMVDQAKHRTSRVAVESRWNERQKVLEADVTVENLAGHKLPSGVGFRRAFIEFTVADADDNILWASGRSDDHGVIVDQAGEPVEGEFWWQQDCSVRLPSQWQPHYQQITRQNQAQIYQELVYNARDQLTTSFLSINGHYKDNRLQPHGFLPEAERIAIAGALGDNTPAATPGEFAMDENLGHAVRPEGEAEHDPDYHNGSGIDRLSYRVEGLRGKPAKVRARLLYQAIPPNYLQDRFCTAKHAAGTPVVDTERLHWLSGHLDLDETPGEGWKVVVGDSGWGGF